MVDRFSYLEDYSTPFMKCLFSCLLLLVATFGYCQTDEFAFGKVPYKDMEIQSYPKDTAASAVMIRELGASRIDDGNDYNLIHKYHGRIKVLKKAGVEYANIEIPLQKSTSTRLEMLKSFRASVFNMENGSMQETKYNPRDILTEKFNENWDIKKITLPNVRVGSIIEYEYEVETPFFVMNFYPWEFQSEIPKIHSEYWATIPANYRYNIALRGALKLTKNESVIIKDCLVAGGGKAECVRYKWAMRHVPAFLEEDFMTSKKNFISAIRFELIQIEHMDGRKDKVTKEWSDADQELRISDRFGVQLKKGDDIVDAKMKSVIATVADPLSKAQELFDLTRNGFRWNGYYGAYSKDGIKKAFASKEGNVGDINLALVAILRHAGLNCDPMILSTRDNGLPTDIYPVLSEFNYVIAKLDIGDKVFLLDATDDYLPFGVLPRRCLNGKGRVMAKKESYWFDIKPADKSKQLTMIELKVSDKGKIAGTISNTYSGYKGAETRSQVYELGNEEAYVKDRANKWSNGEVKKCSLANVNDFAKPVVEKMDIELEEIDFSSASSFLFNPFIAGNHWKKNPFRSAERSYPVDFGVPLEETFVMTIELPENLTASDLPPPIGITLPNNGGRFVYECQQLGNKLTITSNLVISRTVYSSQEYHYLKELFNQVVSSSNADLVLKKKI